MPNSGSQTIYDFLKKSNNVTPKAPEDEAQVPLLDLPCFLQKDQQNNDSSSFNTPCPSDDTLTSSSFAPHSMSNDSFMTPINSTDNISANQYAPSTSSSQSLNSSSIKPNSNQAIDQTTTLPTPPPAQNRQIVAEMTPISENPSTTTINERDSQTSALLSCSNNNISSSGMTTTILHQQQPATRKISNVSISTQNSSAFTPPETPISHINIPKPSSNNSLPSIPDTSINLSTSSLPSNVFNMVSNNNTSTPLSNHTPFQHRSGSIHYTGNNNSNNVNTPINRPVSGSGNISLQNNGKTSIPIVTSIYTTPYNNNNNTEPPPKPKHNNNNNNSNTNRPKPVHPLLLRQSESTSNNNSTISTNNNQVDNNNNIDRNTSTILPLIILPNVSTSNTSIDNTTTATTTTTTSVTTTATGVTDITTTNTTNTASVDFTSESQHLLEYIGSETTRRPKARTSTDSHTIIEIDIELYNYFKSITNKPQNPEVERILILQLSIEEKLERFCNLIDRSIILPDGGVSEQFYIGVEGIITLLLNNISYDLNNKPLLNVPTVSDKTISLICQGIRRMKTQLQSENKDPLIVAKLNQFELDITRKNPINISPRPKVSLTPLLSTNKSRRTIENINATTGTTTATTTTGTNGNGNKENTSTDTQIEVLSSEVKEPSVTVNKKILNEFVKPEILQEINLNNDVIFVMKFSKDGDYLATGGKYGVITIWNLVKNTIVSEIPKALFDSQPYRVFTGHSGQIIDLAWSTNLFLLSASTDNTLRLWHLKKTDYSFVFSRSNNIISVCFHPKDNSYFLTGGSDKTLKIWKLPEGEVVRWVQTPSPLTCSIFYPSGEYVLAGLANGRIIFYKAENLQFYTQIDCRNARGKYSDGRKITGFDFRPSGNVYDILLTSNDSRIRLLRGDNYSLISKIKGASIDHLKFIASFDDSYEHVITCSETGEMYIYILFICL